MSFPSNPSLDQDRWDIPLNENLTAVKAAIGTPTTISDHTATLGAHTSELASQGADINVITGQAVMSLYADFAEYADGLPDGVVPEFAPAAWITTGAVPPIVTDGVLSSTGSGYLYTEIGEGLFFMGGEFSFGGTGTASCGTLALSAKTADLLDNFAHCIVGAAGATLTIRKDGGDFEGVISLGWNSLCKLDGTKYRMSLMRRGNTLTVFGPFGEAASVTDYRVADVFAGDEGVAFWQAGAGAAAKGYLHKAWGFSVEEERYPSFASLTSGAALPKVAVDPSRPSGITSGYGVADAVYVGPLAQGPGIQFGGATKRALGQLTTQLEIGATSMVADRICLGTVQVGIGDNEETFTSVGYPSGTEPYTHTITAATKVHPAGTGIFAESTAGQVIYQSLGNNFVYHPGTVAFPDGMYFGDLSVRLQSSANLLSLALGDSFRVQDGAWNGGHLLLGTYHIWQNGGVLYIKNGAPSSATDGTVIGTQT